MPQRAADFVIRYNGEADGVEDKIRSVATNLGFHYHTTHEHTHDGEDELSFVFQPFEDSTQNKELIIECMESIGKRLSNVNVSLKGTGDTNRPDDPISVQYLIIVERVSDSDNATVNVPGWLSRSIENSS